MARSAVIPDPLFGLELNLAILAILDKEVRRAGEVRQSGRSGMAVSVDMPSFSAVTLSRLSGTPEYRVCPVQYCTVSTI